MLRSTILVITVLLVMNTPGHSQMNLDIRLLSKINHAPYASSAFWQPYSNSVMFVGNANVLALPLASAMRGENWKKEVGTQVGGLLINGGMTWLIKNTVERPRPYNQYPGVLNQHYDPKDFSFPSGHTSWAFQWATATSLYAKKWYVALPCFAYAGSIGYSRMVMGVHYPSDVMTGALLGSASAWLSWKINEKLFIYKSEKKNLKD